MKKLLLMTMLVLSIVTMSSAAASNTFETSVNGREFDLRVDPVIEDDILLVPANDIFGVLGAKLKWADSGQTLIITGRNRSIMLQMGSDRALIDEEEIRLDAPVKRISGRVYVPVTLISQVFSVKVEADAVKRAIKIDDFIRGITLTAGSHILVEQRSGLILLEHASRERVSAGSLNKVMNLLLIFEALEKGTISLTDEVTASKTAAATGGSQIFLEEGEKQSAETLLRSIVMLGANDAAVALAEYTAGSEQAFISQMNAKAEDLGLTDTCYTNVTGLDAEGQYTSAYDLAVIVRELVQKYPSVLDYASAGDFMFYKAGHGGEVPFQVTNTNKLIATYEGATGLKTGYTATAGHCVAGTAERSGIKLICIVLGAPDSSRRFSEAAGLFDYGFGSFSVLE